MEYNNVRTDEQIMETLKFNQPGTSHADRDG